MRGVTSSKNERLPIHIAAVAYFHDEYNENIISNFANNAICTDADSIAVGKSFAFDTPRWARFCSQGINMGLDSVLNLGG